MCVYCEICNWPIPSFHSSSVQFTILNIHFKITTSIPNTTYCTTKDHQPWEWSMTRWSFHKQFKSSKPNSCKLIISLTYENYDHLKSQFCTYHDSWAVMTCAKLWPDGIIGIQMRTKRIFTRFQLYAQKQFVKWVLGACFTKAKFCKNIFSEF